MTTSTSSTQTASSPSGATAATPGSVVAVSAAPSVGSLVGKACGMLAILTLLTGVVYPLLVTGVAKAAFPTEANGSLIVRDGKVMGSRLIGQSFSEPKYFWGRISATAPSPFNGGASTGSNLGPTNEALTKAAKDRIDALRAADPKNEAPIPVDLVTASGSGLDPHITPAAALYQVGRVARARSIPESRVRELVARHTEERDLGFFGEPRVNVVLLNLALDHETKAAPSTSQTPRSD